MTTELQTQQNTSVGLTNLSGFELAQRAAKMLSSSSLVPKEYQGPQGMPNCVIALNMAHRMDADPLMIMQNLVVVHGRPTWSAQFLIATFNSCGRFTAMRFEFFGDKNTDEYGCRATATERATGEKLIGTDVTIAIAKAEGWYGRNGSKWKTMAQQMLTYRAAAWFVRAIAPELSMGLHTQEEVIDITDYKEIKSQPTNLVNQLLSTPASTIAIAGTVVDAEFPIVNEPPTPIETNWELSIKECGDNEALNSLINEMPESVRDELSGLIDAQFDYFNAPDPYADLRVAIAEAESLSEIATLLKEMKPDVKILMTGAIRKRQDEIKALQSA